MTRNTVICLSVAACAAVLGVSRIRAHRHQDPVEPTDALLHDVARAKPSGGRRKRRRDPRADGHATPAGGPGRVSTAPDYFVHRG